MFYRFRCSWLACRQLWPLVVGSRPTCLDELFAWQFNGELAAPMDPRVEYVAAYIRENYQRRLTLTELAGVVNLSRWRLCHLFKTGMGTSPERFLTQVRLERAKQLLEGDFLTVKEVMNRVGMSDASFFARSFKAAYGVTPGKCRNARRKLTVG